MRFYHRHRENLVEIVKSENYHPLIKETIYIKAYIIQAEGDGLDDIVGMLINVFQELLDVWVSTAIQI